MKNVLPWVRLDMRRILVFFIIGLFLGPMILSGNSEVTSHNIGSESVHSSSLFKTMTIQKRLFPQLDETECYAGRRCWDGFHQGFFSDENLVSFGTEVFTFPLGTRIVDVRCEFSAYESLSFSEIPTWVLSLRSWFMQQKHSFTEEYYYRTGGGLEDNNHVTYLSLLFSPNPFVVHGEIRYPTRACIEVTYEEPVKTINSLNSSFDFLIISPEEFSSNLEPLVEHKNDYNIKTKLVTLDEIHGRGRDTQEQIKYFIKDAIENWGISSVLLVGDEERMPARYSYAYNKSIQGHLFISDLYYADVYDANGSFCSWDTNNNDKFGEISINHIIDEKVSIIDKVDLYPDVRLGRLPCVNGAELDVVVDKIIGYETTSVDNSWFKNLILFGGNNNGPLGPFFEGVESESRPVWEGIYLCNKVSELMNDFTAKKFYSSAVFPFLKQSDDVQIPEDEYINEAFNQGAGFAFFSGHGTPTEIHAYVPLLPPGMLSFVYRKDHIQNLSNKEKLPIVIMTGCSNGDFSSLTGIRSPFAWEFVKLESGGAIASFAYTSLSYSCPGSLITETLSGFLTYHLFSTYKDGKETPGEMLTGSLTDYLNDERVFTIKGDDIYLHYKDLEMLSLFGDPTLKIGGYDT